jgi:O-antigen ligase
MIATRAKYANRILLYILCAFPLMPPNIISILSILLLFFSSIYLVYTKQRSFNILFFLSIAGILIPYIIALGWTNDLAKGALIIQVRLMLLALPLAFSFKALWLNDDEQKIAFNVFSIASIAIVVFTNLIMLIKGFTVLNPDTTFSYRISLEEYSGLHPTYYCAIVYMAAFIQLYKLLKGELTKRWEYVLAVSTIFVCTAGGIAAASRATFLAYVVIAGILVLIKIKDHSKRWYFLGAFIIAAVALFFSPTVQNRMQEMNAANMEAPKGNNDNGTNVRSGIFACDIILLKEYWLVGAGTGDAQQELNECLSKYETHVYKAFDYNTHNEYLNIWISTGLLGIIVWLFCLVYPLIRAIKQKHWMHVYFIVFMCICFVTENYLDRQAGATFFALMQTLFFFKTFKQS